jgi:hypothetical protein
LFITVMAALLAATARRGDSGERYVEAIPGCAGVSDSGEQPRAELPAPNASRWCWGSTALALRDRGEEKRRRWAHVRPGGAALAAFFAILILEVTN